MIANGGFFFSSLNTRFRYFTYKMRYRNRNFDGFGIYLEKGLLRSLPLFWSELLYSGCLSVVVCSFWEVCTFKVVNLVGIEEEEGVECTSLFLFGCW